MCRKIVLNGDCVSEEKLNRIVSGMEYPSEFWKCFPSLVQNWVFLTVVYGMQSMWWDLATRVGNFVTVIPQQFDRLLKQLAEMDLQIWPEGLCCQLGFYSHGSYGVLLYNSWSFLVVQRQVVTIRLTELRGILNKKVGCLVIFLDLNRGKQSSIFAPKPPEPAPPPPR